MNKLGSGMREREQMMSKEEMEMRMGLTDIRHRLEGVYHFLCFPLF